MLQVATEQPLFVALFLRKLKLGCCGWKNYEVMFKAATVWHYVTKLTTTAFVFYYYGQSVLDTELDYWHLYNVSYADFLKFDSLSVPVEVMNWQVAVNASLAVLIPILFFLSVFCILYLLIATHLCFCAVYVQSDVPRHLLLEVGHSAHEAEGARDCYKTVCG